MSSFLEEKAYYEIRVTEERFADRSLTQVAGISGVLTKLRMAGAGWIQMNLEGIESGGQNVPLSIFW